MRRGDRKTESSENENKYPRPRRPEPMSAEESKKLLMTLRAQKQALQDQVVEKEKLVEEKARLAEEQAQKAEKTHRLYLEVKTQEQSYLTQLGQIRRLAQENEQQKQQTHHLYLSEQQKHQSALELYQKSEQKYQSTVILYKEEQQKRQAVMVEFKGVQTQAQSYFTSYQESQLQAQSYLTMYETEKKKGDELSIRFEEVQGSRDRYLTLYNESQLALKTERKSKAGIKGWETRRKKENEKLKKEIAEMAIILRDSMERKDEAINSLYAVAERMDRIQQMVDLVDDDTTVTNPIGMAQKMRRMWQAIKEILAE
jgi:hypothetical protein